MKKITMFGGLFEVHPENIDAYLLMDTCGVTWDGLVALMDDDIRERVHRELAPCSHAEFLKRYLELAPEDLAVI